MEVKRIKLGNRYRVCNELVQSIYDENKFYLIFGDSEEANWCRILAKESDPDFSKKDYFAVDPSGGPFMAVGGKISNYLIEKISEEPRDDSEPAFKETTQEKAFTLYMKNTSSYTHVVYSVEKNKSVITDRTVNKLEYTTTSTLDV